MFSDYLYREEKVTLIVLFSLHPLENKKKEGVHVGMASLLKPGQEGAKVTGSSEKNSLISRSPHGEAVNTCVSWACLPQRPGRGGLQLQVSGCRVYSWNSFPGPPGGKGEVLPSLDVNV